MKKVLITVIIIALLAGGGWFAYNTFVGSVAADTVFVSNVGDMGGASPFVSNRYSGVVETQSEVKIDADPEKKIKRVAVKAGDVVKKGDVLFEYDIEDMQYTLDRSRLDKEEAQNNVKSLKLVIENLEKEIKNAQTRNTRLALENRLEEEKLSLKKAEYSLSTLEKTITQTENSIKNAVVKSSADGTVKSVGDPTGDSYITIVSLGDFRINATVSENHIQDFFVDEEITIRSRMDETLTWKGKVTSIETSKPIKSSANDTIIAGQIQQPTRYPVYIAIENSSGLLMGQHVTVEEYVEETIAPNALFLPDSFVMDADTSPSVWVEENGIITKRSITLGEYDDKRFGYEVTGGLTEDDYIAYPDYYIEEGMKTQKLMDYAEE
ncbi:MAG: biotin/lipoyl-binding protein [Clostridia bacterium]|nr:biotin/lipoyl-binding protein [Clostridia bacterium]